MTSSRRLARVVALIVTAWCVGCGAADSVTDFDGQPEPQAVTRTNVCPEVQWWLLLPKSLPVGETTEITVNVRDSDTPLSKLAFDWTAEAGAFSDPDLASTGYTCARVGREILTFTARDEQDCTSVLQLDVQCFDPP